MEKEKPSIFPEEGNPNIEAIKEGWSKEQKIADGLLEQGYEMILDEFEEFVRSKGIYEEKISREDLHNFFTTPKKPTSGPIYDLEREWLKS